MTNLAKRDFDILELSGEKYFQWKVDALTHLLARGLEKTIEKDEKVDPERATEEAIEKVEKCTPREKAQAIAFLRHHIHESLKTEYMFIDDPKVTVYMGDGWYYDFSHTHFDAYSPPDFYCRVGIAGVAVDTVMERTKTLEDNWIPSWNEEFEFPLSVPELALLRIEVHEYDRTDKDDFGGQTCFPVSEIREGIRAIPLCDQEGKQYKNVKLLVRFQFV